jgi:hypothetical protein
MESQGLLFAEPSIADTGVWCSLSEGIDPTQWAGLCRFIGSRSTGEFDIIVKIVKGMKNSSSVSIERAKDVRMPLVSIGPSGIGGEYQWEWFG